MKNENKISFSKDEVKHLKKVCIAIVIIYVGVFGFWIYGIVLEGLK